MSRLVRLASAIFAGASVAACSVITSFSGLEAAPGDGGGAGVGDARPTGSSTPDTYVAPISDGASGSHDAGATHEGASSSTSSGSEGDDASSYDAPAHEAAPSDAGPPDTSDGVGDATAPPPDASGNGCAANVWRDPANCGACGHDCQGGVCTAGACGPVTLATTHNGLGLAIDSAFVYFADNDAGVLYKISKSLTRTGIPTPVASGVVAQSVQGIAADGTYVYWTNKTNAGQVHRALPTGAALTTIATNQPQPDWIASNGATVAWTNQTGNQVMAAPASADGGVAPVVLNATGENGSVLTGIAIDDASVYYAAKTSGGGLAESAPVTGGAVTELGTASWVGIAIDGANVYWTGGSANPSVYQNSKTGTPATERAIAAGALVCPLAVAADGTNVYFLDQGTAICGYAGPNSGGALYRVPIGNRGTLPAPLVTGLSDPQGLAVDDVAVYWVTGGPNGAVMKLAK